MPEQGDPLVYVDQLYAASQSVFEGDPKSDEWPHDLERLATLIDGRPAPKGDARRVRIELRRRMVRAGLIG